MRSDWILLDRKLPIGRHELTFVDKRLRPGDHPSNGAGELVSSRGPILVLRGIVNGEEREVEDTTGVTRASTSGDRWHVTVTEHRGLRWGRLMV